MSPLRALLLSVSVATGGAVSALLVAGATLAEDPSTAQLRDEVARRAGARLVVIGNSVADTTFDDATLGVASSGDPAAAVVLTVSGGGPAHLGALVRGPLADTRPAVVLAWLLPATWRSADPVEGDDLARLLAVAPAGDVRLAETLFGGSRLRAAAAQATARRARLRDLLIHGVTRAAASPYAGPRAGALFTEVVGSWAPPRTLNGNVTTDPDWVTHVLPALQADVVALGAELWLCEPLGDTDADSRFTPEERAAIASTGVTLLDTPAVALPPQAMGGGGHVMPGWQVRASEAVGAWLRSELSSRGR